MRIYFYVPAFVIGLLCGIIATILYFKDDVQDCYVAKGAAVGDMFDDVRELRSKNPFFSPSPTALMNTITINGEPAAGEFICCGPGDCENGLPPCSGLIANLTVDENGIFNFKPGGE
jgi:hypothetical protein